MVSRLAGLSPDCPERECGGAMSAREWLIHSSEIFRASYAYRRHRADAGGSSWGKGEEFLKNFVSI